MSAAARRILYLVGGRALARSLPLACQLGLLDQASASARAASKNGSKLVSQVRAVIALVVILAFSFSK